MIVRFALTVTDPSEAEIATLVEAVTAVVDILNLAEVAPAGTVTDLGTDALLLPLARLIPIPPDGAAEPKVTMPVEDLPPTTVDGLRVSDFRTGGLTVSVAVLVAEPCVPVTVPTT